MNRYFFNVFLIFSAMLLTTSMTPIHAAPRLANTAGWVQTPFEHNPFLFRSEQEAIQALSSKDILMRRSAVQWLGQWTGTYTEFGVAPNEANCVQLRKQAAQITPSLAHALQEMPDGDSLQAARLLMLLGTSAQSAAPTLCAELVSLDYGDGKTQDNEDITARAELANSLTYVCGGSDNVAPTLLALMQSREPETRRNAAAAVQYCIKYTFDIYSPPVMNSHSYFTPERHQKWQTEFRRSLMPILATRVDDKVTRVRLAALMSLESLTYDSADAPWKATQPVLAHAIASPETAVRLAALRVLAYMPGDVSSLTPSLRGEMHDDKEAQKYALAALCHAAGTNRTLVADEFLGDLSSPNLTKRRQAAADVRLLVMPLWNGGFFPDQEPLHWFNDDRLFARYGTPGLTPKQQNEEQKQRQAAQEQVQQSLLTALVRACSDPDAAVRTDAISSLGLIGQWAEAASAHGFLFAPKVKTDLTVKQAVTQVASALQLTDPIQAKYFRDMSMSLWERESWFVNDSSKKETK